MIRQDNRGDVWIVKSIASKEKKRYACESQKPNSKQGIFNNRTFCVFAYILLATTTTTTKTTTKPDKNIVGTRNTTTQTIYKFENGENKRGVREAVANVQKSNAKRKMDINEHVHKVQRWIMITLHNFETETKPKTTINSNSQQRTGNAFKPLQPACMHVYAK